MITVFASRKAILDHVNGEGVSICGGQDLNTTSLEEVVSRTSIMLKVSKIKI